MLCFRVLRRKASRATAAARVAGVEKYKNTTGLNHTKRKNVQFSPHRLTFFRCVARVPPPPC